MTTQEFSDEFDILASSYRRFKDFDQMEQLDSLDFNEYEKSIYLTKAQEDIVKELYSGKYTGESFESSEKIRRELEILVEQKEYSTTVNEDNTEEQEETEPIIEVKLKDDKFIHTVFSLPDNLLYIIYEQVSWKTDNQCLNKLIADIYPVTHDEYWRVRNNPFRGPNTKRVLRLDKGETQVELVSNNNIGTYIIRYIRKPDPIVLDNFPSETIDNVSTPQTCKLNESLHRDILERAVRMALASKINTTNKDKGEK